MTERPSTPGRRFFYVAALFALLFAADFMLGPTSYAAAADGAVLSVFVIVLVTWLLRSSVGLHHIRAQEGPTDPSSRGPIARTSSVVGMAMGGDYTSRAEVARTLGAALSLTEGRATGPLLGDPALEQVLSPLRPEPTAKRVKATRASREEYLKSLEEAVERIERGGSFLGE